MTPPKRNNFLLILILGSLTALSPFSIDMYLPAFPQIAESLGTTVAKVALSLSSYFIGLSFGQLFYGPLLDRYGRKKPLYAGLALYILASVGCLVSQSTDVLVFFRLFQALGGCAAGVVSLAMVRDLFSVKESSKVFSLLILVLSVSPLVAPTAGGYLSAAFGWRSVFIVLAVIAVLNLLVVVFFLPETHQPDETVSLKIKPILKTYLSILQSAQFSTYVFSGAIAFSGLFTYLAGSPIIFMKIYQVSGEVYGWIFAGLSVGFIGASQINILLLKKFQSSSILTVAMVSQTLIGIVFLIGVLNNWFGLTGVIVMLFFFLACIGLTNPNSISLALAPFTKNAGSASALMGFLQMGLGALSSLAVGILGTSEVIHIVAILSGSALLGTITLFIGKKFIRREVTAKPDAVTIPH